MDEILWDACFFLNFFFFDVVREVAGVDEMSLIRDGLVRVRVRCRDPTQLRGFVKIFFNWVEYEIRFVMEDCS